MGTTASVNGRHGARGADFQRVEMRAPVVRCGTGLGGAAHIIS